MISMKIIYNIIIKTLLYCTNREKKTLELIYWKKRKETNELVQLTYINMNIDKEKHHFFKSLWLNKSEFSVFG